MPDPVKTSSHWDLVIKELINDILSVRSMVTIGAFGTLYWLVWNNLPVPEAINKIVDLLLGFWFGTKTAQITRTIRGTDKPKTGDAANEVG